MPWTGYEADDASCQQRDLCQCEVDLEEAGLESGEGHTHFKVQLLPSVHRQSLILVGLSKLVL